jgi:hypothetical protein
MTPSVGVGVHHLPGRSLGRDPFHGSHPIVGGVICTSYRSVFGGWASYPSTLLRGVVLFVRRGTGLVSDRDEVTTVPSVLVRLVWCACSCQSMHAWLGKTFAYTPRGS